MGGPLVLSLGSVNADFQMRVRQPLEAGKTLMGSDFVRLGGGKAANVAVLARRLGVPAGVLGRVGDDDLRDQALAPLRAAGVDIGHVTTAAGRSTAVSMITVPPDGKKSIVLAGNANDAWDEAAARDAVSAIGHAPDGSVLVADYEVPALIVERAVDAARARGLCVVIDPSFADRADTGVLARASAITPNAKEAGHLTDVEVDGLEAAAEAAGRLTGMGIAMVCLKLADGGCLLVHEGRMTVVPSLPASVVDTTGAGDAFTGALAVALLERRPAVEAACHATAASHVAVETYGSQPSYPTRDRIDALLPGLAGNAHAYEP